jgi:hypothetical protein
MRDRGWVRRSIQSVDVLYSGNFQCCCDYIEKIALKESKNEAEGTTKAVGRKGERYIQSKRAREICVLSCLYPQLLLYFTHTKMWRYNPLLQQKETFYSCFLYRRVALGVWASVALGTCRLEHKSEDVCVCVCVCGIATCYWHVKCLADEYAGHCDSHCASSRRLPDCGHVTSRNVIFICNGYSVQKW